MFLNGPFALKEIAKNAAMSLGPIRSMRLKKSRTSLAPDSSQVYRYAFMLPDLVIKHSGPVSGKDILEIGPGDHLATALTFLALGAKSYTALDRFPGAYTSPTALAWYKLVREHFESQFSTPWPSSLDPNMFPDAHPQVRTMPVSIEELGKCGTFDIVCSLAVGEHVSDLKAFAAANRSLLRTCGSAIHYVDFSGHVWERNSKDPLMFRSIPEWLWSAMGSNRGYPNRIPFVNFTETLAAAGLRVDVVSTKPFVHHPEVQEAVFRLLIPTHVGG